MGVLGLEKDLHAFDWGDYGFGEGGGDTSEEKVGKEVGFVFGHFWDPY